MITPVPRTTLCTSTNAYRILLSWLFAILFTSTAQADAEWQYPDPATADDITFKESSCKGRTKKSPARAVASLGGEQEWAPINGEWADFNGDGWCDYISSDGPIVLKGDMNGLHQTAFDLISTALGEVYTMHVVYPVKQGLPYIHIAALHRAYHDDYLFRWDPKLKNFDGGMKGDGFIELLKTVAKREGVKYDVW